MELLGRYQLKGQLNKGGMGTVYQAYDPRFEREVAIKVMPEQFVQEPTFRQRFEREAKILASLQHPGIVAVYDFGEENDRPYLVMQFMSGGTLQERIKHGRASLPDAARLIFNLSKALQAAHEQGVVHRDLKPSNILFDQHGHPFIADFGIARLTGNSTQLTATHATIGTPAYMSPEQVKADKGIDHRSDIYSMGVIFYELLTGRVPYESDTATKTMLMHVLEPVPSILVARPELPYRCEQILQIALAKNKFDRYDSIMEFANEVRETAQGRSKQGGKRPPSAQTTPTQPELSLAELENKINSGEHDLVDDVLSYYHKDQYSVRQEERLQAIRELKEQEARAQQKKQEERAAEVARLREEKRKADSFKQQKNKQLMLGVGAAGLILLFLIVLAFFWLS